MEYPFPTCLEPLVVKNKSLGDDILVSCGHCSACLNKKSFRNQRLCELEEMGTFKYTYFCTLTYYDSHIPTYRFIPYGDNEYTLLDNCPRSLTYGKELFEDEKLYISENEMSYIFGKVKLPYENSISYLNYRDIQLYHKRLRKQLAKITDAKFRYFVTGEYGPDTYRAHWHVVYFFDKELPPQVNKEYIFSIWENGCQGGFERCAGGAVSYASAYVNSGSSLPRLYKDAKISVKSRHSVKLGVESMQVAFADRVNHTVSQDYDRRTAVENVYVSNGYVKRCPSDRTYKNTLFPKPYKYQSTKGNKSVLQCYRAYAIYVQQFADVEMNSVKDLCDEIYNYLYVNQKRTFKRFTDFDTLFIDYLEMWQDGYDQDTNMEKVAQCIYSRLYRFLLFSRLYVERTDRDSQYLIKMKRFYDHEEYQYLCNQYVTQQQYFAQGHDLDISPFYDAIFSLSKLRENALYQSFSTKQNNIHAQKLVKKKINDLSGLLYQKQSQNVKRNVT